MHHLPQPHSNAGILAPPPLIWPWHYNTNRKSNNQFQLASLRGIQVALHDCQLGGRHPLGDADKVAIGSIDSTVVGNSSPSIKLSKNADDDSIATSSSASFITIVKVVDVTMPISLCS